MFPLSEAFGAWRVIDRAAGRIFDVSPLQGETIEEDLAQRDFTVNAMARPLAGGELIDPHGGRADLDAGVLRVLGERAYAEDPLRPLRLARLAAELGLAPDPETERLTQAAAPRVAEASPERVFAELRRLVIADGVLDGLALADRLGLLEAVLPELTALHGVEQSHFHHLDVYEHTLEVLARQVELEGRLEELFGELAPRVQAVLDEPLADELTRGQALRFGALLHDVGKPATRGVRADGRITFIGHDSVGARWCARSAGGCARASASPLPRGVTRHHLVLGFLVHERPLSRRAVYHYLKHTSPGRGRGHAALLRGPAGHARQERRGRHRRAPGARARADGRGARLARSGPPRPPLRGDELAAELGIEPGPELGGLLAALEEAAFAGEATTREEALELARRLRQNQAP